MADIVWSYSGVRPLYDDGATSATAATRDYVIRLRGEGGAPAVDVFGGKITTYRRLAEAAMAQARAGVSGDARRLDGGGGAAGRGLSGGRGRAAGGASCARRFPFLDARWAGRLVRGYGTEAAVMLDGGGDGGAISASGSAGT